MDYKDFFHNLWRSYCHITPQAYSIHRLMETTFGSIKNDHVAFRTWADSPLSLEKVDPTLNSLGYYRQAPYQFPEKHLNAWSYAHTDEDAPLIFFSEIDWQSLSKESQSIITKLISQIDTNLSSPDYLHEGRQWGLITSSEYGLLANESEYAAWLALHGLRANHFTVSINQLADGGVTLEQVVEFLESYHFKLNEVGGKIKGSADVLLEQASTMADLMTVEFSDGVVTKVPGCFYEFARRYKDANGVLYKGFVEANADKIFESTHRRND